MIMINQLTLKVTGGTLVIISLYSQGWGVYSVNRSPPAHTTIHHIHTKAINMYNTPKKTSLVQSIFAVINP